MARRYELSIELGTKHAVGLVAALQLVRAWKRTGGGRVGFFGSSRAQGARVRLELGSLIRPSVMAAFALPYQGEEAAVATRLALTTAAWDSLFEFEAWRALSAPFAGMAHRGRPDLDRPWVVTRGGRKVLGEPEAGTQLHVVGGWGRPSADAVWWAGTARIAAAVLGRAERVIDSDGALVFDAIRVGVPVRGQFEPPDALAGLVPPSLLRDERLWDEVAATARRVYEQGEAPAALMTPEWAKRGREKLRVRLEGPRSVWETVRRRHDKLWRDPRRFFEDSKNPAVRWLGRRRGR